MLFTTLPVIKMDNIILRDQLTSVIVIILT